MIKNDRNKFELTRQAGKSLSGSQIAKTCSTQNNNFDFPGAHRDMHPHPAYIWSS